MREKALVKAESMMEGLIKDASKALNSRKKGETWCRAAVAPACGMGSTLKWLDASRKGATTTLRGKIQEIEEPYKEWKTRIELLYEELRERVQEEHEGKESILEEGVGELVFSEIKGYEVEDLGKVERKYLCVDHKAVMEDIKGGIAQIKGLVIKPKRVLSVRPAKADANE